MPPVSLNRDTILGQHQIFLDARQLSVMPELYAPIVLLSGVGEHFCKHQRVDG